jgi:hypothetical protein
MAVTDTDRHVPHYMQSPPLPSSLLPTPIDRFELQAHTGPYQSWPGRSRLIVDGELHSTAVPGYTLLRQYALSDGFLLVTDFDCPFEESTCFVLLSPYLRVLSHRTLGGMYSSFLLKRVQWCTERELVASFIDHGDWRLTIRSWSVPYLRPRLGLVKDSAFT